MPRTLHYSRFLAASLGLHVLFFAIVVYYAARAGRTLPLITPVDIVNLPQTDQRSLPPINRPVVPPQRPQPLPKPLPEHIVPPKSVPMPKQFGTSPEISLPKTKPAVGTPEGSAKGTSPTGKAGTGKTSAGEFGKGPLPFLTQADIDELARKGMPAKQPGDDSVTLDTDEFKFISYNRWLKIKVESVLHYPELAAVSGLQGTLYIKFDIMKDGSLGDLELLKSSGYKILDDEALRAIRSSAPFQPLPDDWRQDRYTIRAAVLFYLSEAYIR